ncbi:MAG TPA: response regulator [Gemmatimonadaceae bacterium]|nr:response regulator [Gemmatimonadaceae bacterium]
MTEPQRPILIVEDNANDAYLIRTALHRAGVTAPLRIVGDPVDAVLYLQGEGRFADPASHPRPQLMLLDAGIEGGAGLDLLRWTRQRSPARGMPIVVLMEPAPDRDALIAYDLGANSCIARPLTPDTLGQLVRAVAFCRGLDAEATPAAE